MCKSGFKNEVSFLFFLYFKFWFLFPNGLFLIVLYYFCDCNVEFIIIRSVFHQGNIGHRLLSDVKFIIPYLLFMVGVLRCVVE